MTHTSASSIPYYSALPAPPLPPASAAAGKAIAGLQDLRSYFKTDWSLSAWDPTDDHRPWANLAQALVRASAACRELARCFPLQDGVATPETNQWHDLADVLGKAYKQLTFSSPGKSPVDRRVQVLRLIRRPLPQEVWSDVLESEYQFMLSNGCHTLRKEWRSLRDLRVSLKPSGPAAGAGASPHDKAEIALLEAQLAASRAETKRLQAALIARRASRPAPTSESLSSELALAREALRAEDSVENRRAVNRLQVRLSNAGGALRASGDTWTPEDEDSLRTARRTAREEPTEENRRTVNRLQVRKHRLTREGRR